MSATGHTNGWHPAFPIQDMNHHPGPLGLTKRELFAAMAMQGQIAAPSLADPSEKAIAKWAVECADALLAALSDEVTP